MEVVQPVWACGFIPHEMDASPNQLRNGVGSKITNIRRRTDLLYIS